MEPGRPIINVKIQAQMRGIEDEMKNGYKKAAVCPYKSAKCDCDAEEREHCTMTLDPGKKYAKVWKISQCVQLTAQASICL